jgi:hypothetical protein
MPVVVIRKKPLPNREVFTYTISPLIASVVNSDIIGPSKKFSKHVRFLIVLTILSNSYEIACRFSKRDVTACLVFSCRIGPGDSSLSLNILN